MVFTIALALLVLAFMATCETNTQTRCLTPEASQQNFQRRMTFQFENTSLVFNKNNIRSTLVNCSNEATQVRKRIDSKLLPSQLARPATGPPLRVSPRLPVGLTSNSQHAQLDVDELDASRACV